MVEIKGQQQEPVQIWEADEASLSGGNRLMPVKDCTWGGLPYRWLQAN